MKLPISGQTTNRINRIGTLYILSLVNNLLLGTYRVRILLLQTIWVFKNQHLGISKHIHN